MKTLFRSQIRLLTLVAATGAALLASPQAGSAQVVENGNFSANGADFADGANQAGAGNNPTSITDFTVTETPLNFGVGKPGISPFTPSAGPLDSTITYFAFIQEAGALTGTVTGLTAGDTYDLTFDSGERFTGGANTSGSVSLTNAVSSDPLANGFPDFSVPVSVTNAGGFKAFSADFVATSTTAAITLTNTNPGGGDNSLDFANLGVKFVSAPIGVATPEPSTYALLGLGVMALAMLGRRQRA